MQPEPLDFISLLTPREQDILIRVGRGDSCRRIASQLGIAEMTVRKHRANICQKLHCRSAADLIARAANFRCPLLPYST